MSSQCNVDPASVEAEHARQAAQPSSVRLVANAICYNPITAQDKAQVFAAVRACAQGRANAAQHNELLADRALVLEDLHAAYDEDLLNKTRSAKNRRLIVAVTISARWLSVRRRTSGASFVQLGEGYGESSIVSDPIFFLAWATEKTTCWWRTTGESRRMAALAWTRSLAGMARTGWMGGRAITRLTAIAGQGERTIDVQHGHGENEQQDSRT